MIKRIFNWIFKSELIKLREAQLRNTKLCNDLLVQKDKIDNLLGNLSVSVDHHQGARSWAVISIQGQNSDFVKFVDLGEREIREIQHFLRRFDRSTVDCSPIASQYLRIKNLRYGK